MLERYRAVPLAGLIDLFGDGYDFARLQLMPALELETVIFGE